MDVSEDTMSFYTPEKTSPTTSRENTTFINESFHEVKDGDAFFQPARLYDIDNRESLMLLKNLDEIDITRKSLGISQEFWRLPRGSVESKRESISLRRESINLRRESIDFARESLGILPMNSVIDEFNDSTFLSLNVTSVLNRGMLHSEGRSILQSVEETDYPEVFSPAPIPEVDNETDNACNTNVEHTLIGFKKEVLKSFSFEKVVEEDKKFSDSVFMEARVLAIKIKDDSIFEENGEICCLESTCQPVWEIENYEEVCDLKESEKNDSQIKCDVLNLSNNLELTPNSTKPDALNISNDSPLTPKTAELNLNNNSALTPNTTKSDALNLSNISELTPNTTKRSETYENISKIFQNKSLSSRISCSSSVSSKDAKEILENLSEILLSENPTNEQKSEGQNLLYDLADMLFNSRTSSKKESSDDSGHSSIENEQENNTEIVKEKSKKIKKDENKVKDEKSKHEYKSDNEVMPLDLSLTGSKRPLNRSLSCPGPENAPAMVPKVLKNCRVSVPSTLKTFNAKLKPKKIEEKKKGPMKAILPLGNMAKAFNRLNKINCTPPKIEASSLRSKSIGTPKNDSNIPPVAQSTPEQKTQNPNSSQLPKPKFSCPVSPLARPSSSRESCSKLPKTLTESSFNKNKFSPLNTMNRRKSSTDITKETEPLQRLQRSNSMSKTVKPLISNLSLDKKRLKTPGMKSLNLVSKFRKSAGKENLPQ